ncbi:MAG: biotin/lipoyl-containing protein, partial [Halocynthiibacter sp.]
ARVGTRGSGSFVVEIDGVIHALEREAGGWCIDGAKFGANIVRFDHDISVFCGHGHHFVAFDVLARENTAAASGNLIEAPMPGLVKAVYVTVGAVVARGDRLAVLEAMKMEHTLTSARDGVVAEVLCAVGTQVEAGVALIRLEDQDVEAAA